MVDASSSTAPTLVRNIARQKHDRNRAAALAQVKSKVARAAKSRLDEATGRLIDAVEEFHQQLDDSPERVLKLIAKWTKLIST